MPWKPIRFYAIIRLTLFLCLHEYVIILLWLKISWEIYHLPQPLPAPPPPPNPPTTNRPYSLQQT